MALRARRPTPGLVYHSDRRCQYTAMEYQARLAARGLICSMSRSGQCRDNAMAESFFATLKSERTAIQRWPTRAFTTAPDLRPTGFWDRLAAVASQYTNVPDAGSQCSDLATYRANAGPIPGQASNGTFPAPNEAATCRFVIEALWQAYSAVYGMDRVP